MFPEVVTLDTAAVGAVRTTSDSLHCGGKAFSEPPPPSTPPSSQAKAQRASQRLFVRAVAVPLSHAPKYIWECKLGSRSGMVLARDAYENRLWSRRPRQPPSEVFADIKRRQHGEYVPVILR